MVVLRIMHAPIATLAGSGYPHTMRVEGAIGIMCRDTMNGAGGRVVYSMQ